MIMQASRFGRKRAKVCKTIAAIDIHIMRNAPEVMRGIQAAIAVYLVMRSPFGFRPGLISYLAAGAAGSGAAVEFHFAQIVLVTALQMHDLAKQSLAHHIEYGHYVAAITNILQHHHVRLVSLRGTHHFPMIFERDAD